MTLQTVLTAEQVDRYTAAGQWTGRVITDFLDEVAAATPGKVAAIDSRGQLTYAELKRLSDHAALGLLELGVRPGDVVSFQLPNWTEFLVLHFAVTRIGAVNNPLIPIYRDREVGFMVGLARSKVLVVPQEFRGHDYPGMVGRLRERWARLAAPAGRRRPHHGHAKLLGGVHRHPVGGASGPGRAGRAASRPGRRDAADLHLGHHR
jgi:cyclohexanecarboxylate-CoA ligase